jgi:hypothetical protein
MGDGFSQSKTAHQKQRLNQTVFFVHICFYPLKKIFSHQSGYRDKQSKNG